MNLKKNAPILTSTGVLALVEEFKNAEMCRDIPAMQSILELFWEDFDRDPDFSGYGNPEKAELLRIAGAFLSFSGYARNKKDYQSRGKDFLTMAIEAFEFSNLPDKAAESRVLLAHCYWNTGEIEESEALLEMIEAEFGENRLHPVYLRSCINRLLTLIWQKNYDRASEIIKQIAAAIEYCGDLRLQVKFHTEAGIFFRSTNKYPQAVFHYKEAIRKAEKIGSRISVALVLNNLAFLYKETKNFEEAIRCENSAIEIALELNNLGWLPHFLDTKALIYFDAGKFEMALEVIEKSVEIFREGEDAAGLADALWTRSRCLFRLDRSEEALRVFGELLEIARSRIGFSAERKFAAALAGEIYILKNLPLADEVHQFKKERVSRALVDAGGKISAAAALLRLNSHQALSDMLNTQFPELYDEIGIVRRLRRSGKSPKKAEPPAQPKEKIITVPVSSILMERPVARLILPPDKKYSFDFDFKSQTMEIFYFNENLMQKLGISTDAVIAVVPLHELSAGKTVLVSDERHFVVGKTQYDDFADIFFVLDENKNPVIVDESNIIGMPIGYCPFRQAEKNMIQFSKLNNDFGEL